MIASLVALPEKHRRIVIGCFFALVLIIGFLAHTHYGVSADEPAMKKFGNDTYDYLLHGKSAPTAIDWKFHGPIVQLFYAAGQRLSGYTDGADIWFLRHFLSFLIFFAGVIFFYLLAKKYLDDWKLGLLGSAFFVLSPRIFAHAFYNPKDMPAMVFFIIAVYTLFLVLERQSITGLTGHAFACGILISLRTFGILVPFLGFVFLLTDALRERKQGVSAKQAFISVILQPILVMIATVIVWPVLWHNPIGNFFAAMFDNASRQGGGLFLGQLYDYTPWNYVPVWMAITTPLLYTALFLTGSILLLSYALPHPRIFLRNDRQRVTTLAWFFLPLLALMMFRIGIFNEWRHVMFLYPAFLLIGLDGLGWLLMITAGKKLWHGIVIGCVTLSVVFTAFWMLKNHPFEYAYFSIPHQLVDGNFELDYWSLSYRPALEYILATDKREHINVYPASRTAVAGADTLPLSEWNRLYFVQSEEADYVIDNFAPSQYKKKMPENKALHSIVVDGLTIATIYKGPAPAGAFAKQNFNTTE